MKQPNVKEYLVPSNLDEALDMLVGDKVVPLAGATDLFCVENDDINAFLDITNIGLSYIKEEGDKIHIGAGTTMKQVIQSELLEKEFTALHDACKVLADITIRNVATVGGNICTALSSGDVIPAFFVVGAEFVLRSKKGTRTVKVDNFFTGNRQTVMEKDELLIEMIIDRYHKGTNKGTAFEKIARNSVDIAVASAAVGMTVESGKITDVRIALGAVAPTVVRAPKAEQQLIGKELDEKLALEVANSIADEIAPITNIRSTKEYRTDVTCELTRRALLRAYKQAK